MSVSMDKSLESGFLSLEMILMNQGVNKTEERARRFHPKSRITLSQNLSEFRKLCTIFQYSSLPYFHKQITAMIDTFNRQSPSLSYRHFVSFLQT